MTIASRYPFTFLLLSQVLAIAGCAKPPAPAIKPAPPDVFVEVPISRGVTDYEDFTGRTEAFKMVDVRPEITGRLKSVYFRDGEFVTAGKPLFDIEDELYRAATKKVAADLEKSKADISNWKAQILLAKLRLRQRSEERRVGKECA